MTVYSLEENFILDNYPKCDASRWKTTDEGVILTLAKGKKVPNKVLCHFPFISRLFMSSKTANLMRWHTEELKKDGKLRHPADSLAWESLDDR